MKTAFYDSILGYLRLDYQGDSLIGLSVKREKGSSCPSEFTDEVYRQICEYFAGKRKSFNVKYTLVGTPFAKNVWHVLETIPYGKVMTYGEVAQRLGNKKAARAVGGACNKNPIWLIVPCHRVIGADGSNTGYAGGMEIKEKLLRLENSILL